MKTLNIALALTIAFLASACGLADTPDFAGLYQGTATYSFQEDFGEFGSIEDDGIAEGTVTVTRSESGRLLISGLEDECVIGATDHGTYLEIDSICIVDYDGGVRATYSWSGEGEFSESGKLRLDVVAGTIVEEKVLYEHGFEWEQFGTGDYVIAFSGRPM